MDDDLSIINGPTAPERMGALIGSLIEGLDYGDMPVDEQRAVLSDMQDVLAEMVRGTTMIMRMYFDLVEATQPPPPLPVFAPIAKGLLVSETMNFDVIAEWTGRDRWAVRTIEFGTGNCVEVGTMTRVEARRFLHELYECD